MEDGQAAVYGDTVISDVPGTGERIDETFFEPGGSMTAEWTVIGAVRKLIHSRSPENNIFA